MDGNMSKVKFFKVEAGGIISLWVQLPRRVTVCVAEVGENISEEEAIKRAEAYWERKDRIEKPTAKLHEKYPGQQIYIGFLPCGDCIFEGEYSEYVYALKLRRKNKKYQIKEAIKIF